MRRWLLPTLFLAILIGAWQLAASSGALADLLKLESYAVASPLEIAESLWQSRSLLAENAWVTLREMLLGLGLSLVVGVALAYAMHLSGVVRDTLNPLIVVSQTIPILAIAPILIIWLGFGIWPKAIVVLLICFFPVAVSTFAGLGTADPEATKMMRSLDASRLADPLARRDAHGLALLLHRRSTRGRPRPDRGDLRRVGRIELGTRPPDPPGQRPAGNGAPLRFGGRFSPRWRSSSLP